MAKTSTGDTYKATSAYDVNQVAQFVSDLSVIESLTTLLNAGAGIGVGKGFVKLEDSTSGVDLVNVRALVFTSAGTITLTDGNGHTENNVAVVAGQTLLCAFTHAADIACTVYALT